MLLDLQQVLALLAVAIVVIAVPGPSVLFVVGRAVSLGTKAALATVAGNEVGLLIQVVAVAVGLGTLVQSSIMIYNIIKLVGAAYLIYLGVQAFLHRRDLASAVHSRQRPQASLRVFTEGLIVGVSNPKGLLLFAAILPQFVDRAAGHVPLQMFELGLVCVSIAFVSDSVWALFAGVASGWLCRTPRRMEIIGGGAGIVMIGLGVNLAIAGRRD